MWSSSLPTSTSRAWSLTRPFALPKGSYRAVGTRWVHISLRMQPIEAVGQVVQLLREEVAVAIQGDRRRLVAQVVLHGLDARALADEQARAGVSKVMHSQAAGRPAARAAGLKYRSANLGSEAAHPGAS